MYSPWLNSPRYGSAVKRIRRWMGGSAIKCVSTFDSGFNTAPCRSIVSDLQFRIRPVQPQALRNILTAVTARNSAKASLKPRTGSA